MGLIESEKLITDIQGIASEVCMESPYDPEWFTRLHNRQSEIIRIIEMQPKVDAEPVRHGRWVDHMVRDWRCSECGEKIQKVRKVDGYCYDDKPNYCPNCGAKMDEEAQ